MNTITQLYGDWQSDAAARVKAAANKMAANCDNCSDATDPTNKGTVTIPSHPDGNNRSLVNLPKNSSNLGEANKEHNIMSVTKPNGTGQGEYTTPRNGNALDAAATSPTTALDKIATMLHGAVQGLQTGAPQSKEAEATFTLPVCLASDDSLMDKLASIGGVMLGTEEGQQAVAEVLEREAGIKEAASLISGVREELAKTASYVELADQQQYIMNTQLIKSASDEAAHITWLESYATDIEKQAYAQGAADAEAIDAGIDAGVEPSIPGAEELSDEDVMATIQQMVQSGEIEQEEAEALLQALGADGSVGATFEQLAQELTQAVESGQIDPDTAEVIAQAILEDAGLADSAGAPDGGDEEAAAIDAAQEGVNKTASVLNDLFNPLA